MLRIPRQIERLRPGLPCRVRQLVPVLVALALFVNRPVSGREFTQEAFQGTPGAAAQATLEIRPEAMEGLVDHEFDCDGRRLLIRTNLGPGHQGDIAGIAAAVERCYGFLEGQAGRRISGGVLLYLLEFPQRPRCYRFRAEVADDAGWSQIRVALLSEREAAAGVLGSRHVSELLFDTLPHELAHELVAAEPTLLHDVDDEPARGTRWFIEGLCEAWAKAFASAEAPAEWRRGMARRHLDRPTGHPALERDVWTWGRSATADPRRESDLYGLSMLLVEAWCEVVPARELLARMVARGGGADGRVLESLLVETTGSGCDALMRRARQMRHRYAAPLHIGRPTTSSGPNG